MSYSNLIRLGGVAAMVGGVLYAGVGLLEKHLAEDLVFSGYIGYRIIVVSLPLGTMAAIVALYALHRDRYGRTGTVLCLTAVLGLALATGALILRVLAAYPIYAFPDSGLFGALIVLGLLVATAGMVLLGILSVAWRILPPWCGIALMVASPFVGVFFTMTALAALSVLAGGSALGRAFQALGGVPCAVVGYYIFRAAGQRTERPARVRTSQNSVEAKFAEFTFHALG
jgi:hypothetical protein